MKYLAPIILAYVTILFYGCSSSGTLDNTPLTETEWIMFEMDGVKCEPSSGKNVTMIFDGTAKKMGGKAPCNTYGSTYTNPQTKFLLVMFFQLKWPVLSLKRNQHITKYSQGSMLTRYPAINCIFLIPAVW